MIQVRTNHQSGLLVPKSMQWNVSYKTYTTYCFGIRDHSFKTCYCSPTCIYFNLAKSSEESPHLVKQIPF